MAQRKSEEKKDLFKIPEFKSKQSDTEMIKCKSEKQDIGTPKLQRDDYILAEIPSFKEKMPRRMSETNSESSQEKKKSTHKAKAADASSEAKKSSFKKKNIKILIKSIPSKYYIL